MRVRSLYIFAIGHGGSVPDSETKTVSTGLYEKYAGRSGPTALITGLAENDLMIAALCGNLPLNDVKVGPEAKRTDLKPNDRQAPAPTDSAGAYIVIHGFDPDGGGTVEVDDIVKAIVTVIPKEQRDRLNKVALIQCSAASGKHKDEWDGKGLLDDPNQMPYIIRLLAALKKQNMQPMLAGWDGYISVAPHRPTKVVQVGDDPLNFETIGQPVRSRPPGASSKTPFNKDVDLNTIVGRKIIHHSHDYQTVRDEDRARQKHYYVIDREGKVRVDFAGWSDNPAIKDKLASLGHNKASK